MKLTKTIAQCLAAAALAWSAAACNSVSTHVELRPDYDVGALKTFDWIERPEDENPASEIVPTYRMRLRGAIEKALVDRGFVRASEAPDFRVVFYSHMKRKRRWVSTHGYAVVPWGVDAWGYRYGRWVPVRQDRPELYEVGTVVLDLVDGKSGELIWRGWARGAADRELEVDDLEVMMKKLAKKLPKSATP